MTLHEYLNQDNPLKKPIVIVKEGEIKRGVHNKITGLTAIWIEGIEYEYLLRESTGAIYTCDEGNPRARSVFNLE